MGKDAKPMVTPLQRVLKDMTLAERVRFMVKYAAGHVRSGRRKKVDKRNER